MSDGRIRGFQSYRYPNREVSSRIGIPPNSESSIFFTIHGRIPHDLMDGRRFHISLRCGTLDVCTPTSRRVPRGLPPVIPRWDAKKSQYFPVLNHDVMVSGWFLVLEGRDEYQTLWESLGYSISSRKPEPKIHHEFSGDLVGNSSLFTAPYK